MGHLTENRHRQTVTIRHANWHVHNPDTFASREGHSFFLLSNSQSAGERSISMRKQKNGLLLVSLSLSLFCPSIMINCGSAVSYPAATELEPNCVRYINLIL